MLTKSKNHNPNYLAKVVKLGKPIQHPNAERLFGWIIDGNRVWTDNINYKEGNIVIYFPLECQINPLILSRLNLYSKSELNTDKTQKGFFNDTGRVKAIRLRGEPSEGFILKIGVLFEGLGYTDVAHWQPLEESENNILNCEFDIVDLIGVKDIWICKKYIPKSDIRVSGENTGGTKKRNKKKDILIENQFRFHYDTEQLKKNIHKIHPEDLITISKKYHGTSGISANVLCKKQLHPIHKFLIHNITIENCFLLPWLFIVILLQVYSKSAAWTIWGLYAPHLLMIFFNKKYRIFMHQMLRDSNPVEYKDICSSRKVIKSVGEEIKRGGSYYKFDIWRHCHNILTGKTHFSSNCLEPGITLYYEIIGYLSNDSMIQKGYDYGCENPLKSWTAKELYTNLDDKLLSLEKKNEMNLVPNINFKILIYRITYTTPEGRIVEYSWQQIKQYCQRYNLNMPKTYYEGKVSDYIDSDFSDGSNHDVFLEQLQHKHLEKQDDECVNQVPDEGIVIRIENGKSMAYKLKSFAFLERESKTLDEGTDIETEQSE